MNRNPVTSIQTGTEPNAETVTEKSTGAGEQEFHVTYYDSDCGRARTEVFDDIAAAERFASRVVCDEDDWAVIDAIPLRQSRLAA